MAEKPHGYHKVKCCVNCHFSTDDNDCRKFKIDIEDTPDWVCDAHQKIIYKMTKKQQLEFWRNWLKKYKCGKCNKTVFRVLRFGGESVWYCHQCAVLIAQSTS